MQHTDLHAPLSAGLQRIADAVERSLGQPGATAKPPGGAREPRVGVAYSGGVDSTVLAALTARAVGHENTVLLLGVSPSLAKRERRLAHRQAEQLGLRLVEVATNELANPDYAANPVDRCYHCKDELFSVLDTKVVDELGLDAIAYGENADDAARPDRPGSRAAKEHRVLHPLAEAGVTKADVRSIAVELGLSSALKPAAPCLASRIPHGEPVSAEKLHAVDLAEDAVLAAGFSDCRVRHHGTIARIEVPSDEFHLVADEGLRTRLLTQVRAAGFDHATLDLGGIQSGKFTLTLLAPERERQRATKGQPLVPERERQRATKGQPPVPERERQRATKGPRSVPDTPTTNSAATEAAGALRRRAERDAQGPAERDAQGPAMEDQQ